MRFAQHSIIFLRTLANEWRSTTIDISEVAIYWSWSMIMFRSSNFLRLQLVPPRAHSLYHNDEFEWIVIRFCRSISKISVTFADFKQNRDVWTNFCAISKYKFRYVRSVWVALLTADRPRDEQINITRPVVAFSDWFAKAPEKSSKSSVSGCGLDFSGSEHENYGELLWTLRWWYFIR